MTYKELKTKLLSFDKELLDGQSATLHDIDTTEFYGVYSCALEGDTPIEGIFPCMSDEGVGEGRPLSYSELIPWLEKPEIENEKAYCFLGEEYLYEIIDVQISEDMDENQIVMVGKEIKG